MVKHLFTAAVLLLLAFPFSARADMLSDAEALIHNGKAEQAYALLEPREFERAGDPDFDYLLGLAALEAGKPGRATLALERVLLVNPNYAGARLDLGRAYYALGDFTRAKTELTAVLKLDPPPAAQQTAEQYLAAIDAATTKPAKTVVGGYLDMSGGWDSNVNAANDVSSIFIPFFGLTAGLDPSSIETESGYYGLGLGADVTHAFGAQSSVNASLNATSRAHGRDRAEPFDWASYNIKVGLAGSPNESAKRVTYFNQRYDLDGVHNYDTQGLYGDWKYLLDTRTQLQTYAQYTAVRYQPDTLRANNFNQFVAGGGLIWAGGRRSLTAASLYLGTEAETEGRVDGDKHLVGVRTGVQWACAESCDAYVNIGIQYGKYQTDNLLFGVRREDIQYDAMVGVNYRFARSWSVRPQLLFVRSDSNVVINDYERYDVSISLRRDF